MIATYRLQLQPDFDFAAVESVLPYLRDLGVSHIYLSPVNEARIGSTHGYDVIDHNEIRKELGGREGFDRMLEKARNEGFEFIIDFVPNHAGVGPRNVYWQDVLAYGPHSPFARFFDIDWKPLKPELQGKILLPFLGDTYGECLERGEITLSYDDGRFFANYFDNKYALSPCSYATILESALPRYERTEQYWTLRDVAESYRKLQPDEREKAEALRPRLLVLRNQIDFASLLPSLQGEGLHELLEEQYWRLSFWKTAGSEINYRRFFDINGLVGLRMEDAQVFWDAHRLMGELLAQQGITGLRVDHIDGLFDPHRYLGALRDLGARHIWVEKILAPGEILPEGWPVEGTSGYEFLNDVMGVLLNPAAEIPLDRTYRRFVTDAEGYDDVVYAAKLDVMSTSLSSELFRLSYELDRISEADYRTRDFTLEALRNALSAIVASFDRYRTYLPYDPESAREVVQHAVHRAMQRNHVDEPTVYEFASRVIMGDVRDDLQPIRQLWTGRFQQFTAPVAAKGTEDTAFYRYYRLTALNEVGGEPSRFGVPMQAFHSHNRFRAIRYPRNLLATATHDHKRGEDTRMRLIALGEVPELWDRTVADLTKIAERHLTDRGPSRADQYLFFQTLAALWHNADRDELSERLAAYMLKATRESKEETSWLNLDNAYETNLQTFVRNVIEDPQTDEALSEIAHLLARYGFFNTLSQVVIKITAPGVPDIYQGSEMGDLSLVDPDNRRPVAFERNARLLKEMKDLVAQPDEKYLHRLITEGDARAKLYLTARMLHYRKHHPQVFEGSYRALETDEEGTCHWVTYSREHEGEALLVAVPRFPGTWDQHREVRIALPPELQGRQWMDVFTGRPYRFDRFVETGALSTPWSVLASDAVTLAQPAEATARRTIRR